MIIVINTYWLRAKMLDIFDCSICNKQTYFSHIFWQSNRDMWLIRGESLWNCTCGWKSHYWFLSRRWRRLCQPWSKVYTETAPHWNVLRSVDSFVYMSVTATSKKLYWNSTDWQGSVFSWGNKQIRLILNCDACVRNDMWHTTTGFWHPSSEHLRSFIL